MHSCCFWCKNVRIIALPFNLSDSSIVSILRFNCQWLNVICWWSFLHSFTGYWIISGPWGKGWSLDKRLDAIALQIIEYGDILLSYCGLVWCLSAAFTVFIKPISCCSIKLLIWVYGGLRKYNKNWTSLLHFLFYLLVYYLNLTE